MLKVDLKNFTSSKEWIWWMKYGKHIEALAIILLLIFTFSSYHNNTEKLKEVEKTCPCAFQYCVKNKSDLQIDSSQLNLNYSNFSWNETPENSSSS